MIVYYIYRGPLRTALRYIANPEKTTLRPGSVAAESTEGVRPGEPRQLVSGVNCTPENARSVMEKTKRQVLKTGGRIAVHVIQSFLEGEVTPELAHLIGKQFAEECWGDRFEVLLATHMNKKAVHTHFIVNSVSFADGWKYDFTNTELERLNRIDRRICREYGLRVPEQPKVQRSSYSVWLADQKGEPTFAGSIREDLDRAAEASLTDMEFFRLLGEMGYAVKLGDEDGHRLAHPVFKPPGADHFFRFDTLGPAYDLDEILDRVARNRHRTDPFPEETRQRVRRYRAEKPFTGPPDRLARLYAHYCYELHIVRENPGYLKKRSYTLRTDLRKLDQLDAQTRFLAENRIGTMEELREIEKRFQGEYAVLDKKRDCLYQKKYRCRERGNTEAIPEIDGQIADIRERTAECHRKIALCKAVAGRALRLQAELEALIEQEKKEENAREQYVGRSGRTGRENEPERR